MQTINILLADDDPGHRYLLNRVIGNGRSNVRITTAQDFNEFKRATACTLFDCAVIDFNMSNECPANEFVAHFRSVHADCPVIIVSGSDEQEVAIQSFRCGGADFIHKDKAVGKDILWSRIKQLITNRKRRVAERRRRERREAQLRAMAETDALTGLANRRAIDQLFGENGPTVLDRRAESSIIILDIDHFKAVNDSYGHGEGDRILSNVGALLRRFSNAHDITARWGGEEFLMILPRTGLVDAVRCAEKLRIEIAQTIRCGGNDGDPVTVSLGVCTVKSSEFEMSSIDRADAALYQAKHRGRNRVCTWELCQFESKIPCDADLAPETRLDQSLEIMLPRLGPTQREHLTSHSCSVSTAAILVGMSAHLDGQALDALRIAGLCHDIGKVATPECVLSKPGPLDASERFLVDMHADDGAYLSQRMGFAPRVSALVRGSHIRFDKSNANLLDPASSALSVADAYVAMTSERPYHKKYSSSEALDELRRESGGQFDPRAVDACVACFST